MGWGTEVLRGKGGGCAVESSGREGGGILLERTEANAPRPSLGVTCSHVRRTLSGSEEEKKGLSVFPSPNRSEGGSAMVEVGKDSTIGRTCDRGLCSAHQKNPNLGKILRGGILNQRGRAIQGQG